MLMTLKTKIVSDGQQVYRDAKHNGLKDVKYNEEIEVRFFFISAIM